MSYTNSVIQQNHLLMCFILSDTYSARHHLEKKSMCACLQDFLRSIPGSLLCCELHEEWMEVLEEEEDEDEQVQEIKR